MAWDGFVKAIERMLAAFSDYGRDIDAYRVIEEGDTLAVYYCMSVTHDGPLHNQQGTVLPATGRFITFAGIDMVIFNDEGEIVEIVAMNDRLEIMEKLTS